MCGKVRGFNISDYFIIINLKHKDKYIQVCFGTFRTCAVHIYPIQKVILLCYPKI